MERQVWLRQLWEWLETSSAFLSSAKRKIFRHFSLLSETYLIKGLFSFLGDVYSLQQTPDISVSGGPPVPPVYLCHQSPGHSGGQEQSVSVSQAPRLNLIPPRWLCPPASTWCWSVSVTWLSPPASSWRPPPPLRDTRLATSTSSVCVWSELYSISHL